MTRAYTMENVQAAGLKVISDLRFGIITSAIADNYAITTKHPTLLFLDPAGGAKDVLLPAEASSQGLVVIVVNTADAAETITVKEDSDTTGIATVAQNEAAILFCDGATWHGFVMVK